MQVSLFTLGAVGYETQEAITDTFTFQILLQIT